MTPPSGTLTDIDRAGATGREIAQQPAMWRQVAADLASHREALHDFLGPLLARDDLRIVLTGAGTSAFAGDLLAPALTGRLRRRVDTVATTDIVSNPAEAFAEDLPTLLVSFARSGDSPESVAATVLADRFLGSVHHLIVTCNPDGELAKTHGAAERSYVLLMPPATNDAGFAMTSSFTSMVLATWLALAPGAGEAETAERLADAGTAVLRDHADAVAGLAARGYQRIVYLGSGPLTALARESALKVLELSAGSIVSFFDSALGFRHGPISVIDGHSLAIVYLSGDPYTRRYDEDIAVELRSRMGVGNVVVVAAKPSGRLDPVWLVPGLDDAPDVLAALPFVLVAQLFAVGTSLSLGLTPDSPFPSGEVNRVVKGVTVHPYDER
ncbi:SIS domain-containing protein [Actinoplanes sp. NBRC 103695]|uniref:SIS domain-containing protein n=1 Tax=Actinoplanes sp. NBRC 103695 TaxID=3032202 RepID=UPI00249FEFC0|nr:SIS domain-containing protein [Actinoplanes sp. NBRC 103695]GLY94039.1 putative tagatose-6-phosphate ketose/aldose isomerase [Actinoplanes sp. NBRC 103695]